jgi:hypothetical protein
VTVLLSVPSIPQIFASTPAGMRTGKWKFTYTPSVAHTALNETFYYLVCSAVDGSAISIGGPVAHSGAAHLLVQGSTYATCIDQNITFSASQAITITIDIPLQQVTIAGATTGDGVYSVSSAMSWAAGEIRVGCDNAYFDGTYYGAPAVQGTISNVTDFAATGSVISGTITSTCTATASISAKNRMTGTILSVCTANAALVARVQRTATCTSASVVTGSINDGSVAGTSITGTIASTCTLSATAAARSRITGTSIGTCTPSATLRNGAVVVPVVVPPVVTVGSFYAYTPEGTSFLSEEGSSVSSNGTVISASDRNKNSVRLGYILTYDDEILP